MNAHVNANCIGCGLCPGICPDVFFITEGGTAAASKDIDPAVEDQVREAAESCPVSAIEVR